MQKKLISVLMVAFMLATTLLSLTACSAREATQDGVDAAAAAIGHKVGAVHYVFFGDVNSDGDYNMKDVLLIRKFIANMEITDADEDAMDANADGDVDMKDVLHLRKFVAHVPGVTLTSATKATKATTTQAPVTTTSTTTTTTPPTSTTAATPPTYISKEDPAINFIDGNETLGVWWWQDVGYGTSTETNYLDLLEKNQFNEIYFYSYTKLWDSGSRAKLHDFVQRVLARGMRVSILFDDVAVTQSNYNDAWSRTISGFVSYKQEFPGDESFYGVHCDVEPRASTANLQGYVDYFIPKIKDAQSKGIQVEVDLPCGWESYGRNIVYNGVTGIYNIIAETVDTMCLMSYSDSAADIYGMAYYPFEAAKKAGTKVVFGIELDDSGEGHENGRVDSRVDFYEESKYDAYYELFLLDARLKAVGLDIPYGYAIHHMKAYYKLRLFPLEGL